MGYRLDIALPDAALNGQSAGRAPLDHLHDIDPLQG